MHLHRGTSSPADSTALEEREDRGVVVDHVADVVALRLGTDHDRRHPKPIASEPLVCGLPGLDRGGSNPRRVGGAPLAVPRYCDHQDGQAARYACRRGSIAPLSSRGLGRRPLTAETRVRIPVAVLAFSLQMSTFEGAKRGFGGRLQEDPPPGTAENGSNLGPIVDRVRTIWRR